MAPPPHRALHVDVQQVCDRLSLQVGGMQTGWNVLREHKERLSQTKRFFKLPLLEYYLRRYDRVLFIDDDVIISPRTPDLFSAVPCTSVAVRSSRPVPCASTSSSRSWADTKKAAWLCPAESK